MFMQCSIRLRVAKLEIGKDLVNSSHEVVEYFVVKRSTSRAIRLQEGLRLPCTSFLPNFKPIANPHAINSPHVCLVKPRPAPSGTEALINSSGTCRNPFSLKLRRIASPQVHDALYFFAASEPLSAIRPLSEGSPSFMFFHSLSLSSFALRPLSSSTKLDRETGHLSRPGSAAGQSTRCQCTRRSSFFCKLFGSADSQNCGRCNRYHQVDKRVPRNQ